MNAMLNIVEGTSRLDREIPILEKKLNALESEVEQFIRSNTIKVQEQTSYQENYQHLCELCNTSKANLE